MNEINSISKFLKENNIELYEKFRRIVAMARYRQDARQEINAQSIPIFKHLIPLIIMKKRGINFPNSWVGEIKAFLLTIDAKNRKKNKLWFTAQEIQNVLDGLLDSIVVKKIIFKKLESFKIPNTVKKDIEIFFKNEPKLEKLKIDLKYIPSEDDKELTVFFNNKPL